jgi:hypothetical protein
LECESFDENLFRQIISFVFNRFIVSVILSGQSRDDVLDTIHNQLEDLSDEMRIGKIDIEQYEINLVNFNLYSI